MSFYFILTVLLSMNVVVAVMILMIHMLNYEFLMLLKTNISTYLIKCQELMKQDIYLGKRLVHVNLD